MYYPYIFCLCSVSIFVAYEAEASNCGKPYAPRGRISGGVEAQPNKLPWMVSLQASGKDKQLQHLCGGTLVRVSDKVEASDIVITAAHCMGFDPTHVIVGAHNLSQTNAEQKLVAIEKRIPHERYNSDGTLSNDIAVLKLAAPVKFGRNIGPICLPTKDEQVPDNAIGTTAGWGLLNDPELESGPISSLKTSDVLRRVDMPVVNSTYCVSIYKTLRMFVDPKLMLCGGDLAGGKGFCNSDSGGPYIVKNAQGAYVLQGVVSFSEGCAKKKFPGVFVRVSAYVDWIQNQIRVNSKVI